LGTRTRVVTGTASSRTRRPPRAVEPHDRSGFSTSVGQVPAERLRTIFDGMFDGVWLVSAEGTTTYANAAMAELLGTTPDAMRGRPITAFLDPELWRDVTGFLDRQRVQAGERMQIRFRRSDGSDLFGIVAGSPITTRDDIHVGTMLNVSDVTGKRSIDAQVVQNQRLEAIGQFAGGIAHDFNNLLTAIQGYTQLAIDNLGPEDPIRHDLAQVIASTERATAITSKLSRASGSKSKSRPPRRKLGKSSKSSSSGMVSENFRSSKKFANARTSTRFTWRRTMAGRCRNSSPANTSPSN